jgi:hypothetical protein
LHARRNERGGNVRICVSSSDWSIEEHFTYETLRRGVLDNPCRRIIAGGLYPPLNDQGGLTLRRCTRRLQRKHVSLTPRARNLPRKGRPCAAGGVPCVLLKTEKRYIGQKRAASRNHAGFAAILLQGSTAGRFSCADRFVRAGIFFHVTPVKRLFVRD